MDGFKVVYRNPGHWDIYQNSRRIYQIRGCRGNVVVFDDHPEHGQVFNCKTVSLAMGYISEQLMFEKL